MASAPLNWLLKIGGDALNTTAQTLSAAINELKTAISGKQDTLTFDSAPTENSNNPVTSDGIFDALTSKANSADLATVATSGSYNDLTDRPSPIDVSNKMDKDGSNAANLVQFPKKFSVGSGYAETTTLVVGEIKSNGDFYFKYSERNSSKILISNIPKTLLFGSSSEYPTARAPYVSIGTVFESFNDTEYHGLHLRSGNPAGSLYSASSSIYAQYTALSGEGGENDYSIVITLKLVNRNNQYYDLVATASQFQGSIGVSGDPVIFFAHGASINYSYLKTTSAPIKATGDYSFAHGYGAQATGDYSYAGGYAYDAEHPIVASGTASHAEGRSTIAGGIGAHAEGYVTYASGDYSHAEGQSTIASGANTHAEGASTRAIGIASHAEGASTAANGNYTHAEGSGTTASGQYSHAGGYGVQALRNASFVQGNSSGKFNDSAFTENHQHVFGIDMSAGQWSTATEVEDAYNGCEGTIINDTTVTLDLEAQGVYLLFQTAYTISNGAIFGSALNLIACHGLSTGTPTTVQMKTTTAPTTLTMLANNKISIRNAAAARATEFHLIRIQ